MREYRYGPVTVEIDGALIRLSIEKDDYFVEYPVSVEHVEKRYIDILVWLLFWGHGINAQVNGIDAPDYVARGESFAPASDKVMLSYSAGADSTAAAILYPAQPVLIERTYAPAYMRRALGIAEKIGALVVRTDAEKARLRLGKTHGFNVGLGYASVLAPLAGVLGIGEITFGAVWDDVAFYYGDRLERADITGRTAKIRKLAAQGGLELSYPVAGISEVWTTHIAATGLQPYSSCHGDGDQHCLACYKCLRKEGIQGRKLSDAAFKKLTPILNKRPLKMAASTIYGLQKAGYGISQFDAIDVSFCDRYSMEHYEAYATPRCRQAVIAELAKRGIQPQTPQDSQNIDRFITAVNNLQDLK
jgi:hypothetical protein